MDEHDNVETEAEQHERLRLASLADPKSAYYRGMCRVLEEADARERAVKRRADTVTLPFVVSSETRRAMETRFGWNVQCADMGVRSRFPEFIAALIYCMSMRNLLKGGCDGLEVVCLDEDLAMMTARSASYVHVCRTSATVRLQAGYAHEDVQLQKLTTSNKSSVALAAMEVMRQLTGDGGSRVCASAALCRRSADVLLINHARTPVSLAQAVATAHAHGASVVEGECFFQPDMLISDEGELEAFPGRYVIDRDRDELCYIPDADPSMSFSHPYSALMSFFLNHEYVGRGGRWLVEKSMSKYGVYSYVIRAANTDAFASSELVSAHYYPTSMAKVTKLEYPVFDARAFARGQNPIGKCGVNIFSSLFDKVVEKMIACDIKAITPENVITALRDRNNTVVLHGDVVKRPDRMLYSDEAKAAVGICAIVKWRKLAAGAELNVLLDAVKKRYALRDASATKLLMLAVSTKLGSWWPGDGSQVSISNAMVDLDEWMKDMEVSVESIDSVVAVTRTIGATEYTVGAGECHPWLPGHSKSRYSFPKFTSSRFSAVIDRAKKFARSVSGSSSSGVSIEIPDGGSTANGFFPASSDSHSSSSDARYEAEVSVRAGAHAVQNIEHRLESHEASPQLTDFQRSLVNKLAQDQDALHIGREPRQVVRYEGPTRPDVVPVATLKVPVVSAIQTDYDRLMPGLSVHDAEVVAHIASESRFDRNIDVNMSINDSKRDIAKPRRVRRSKVRTAGAGSRPRDQAGLIAALFKRNAGVPPTRGHVDLDSMPSRTIDRFISVCFNRRWEKILANELDNGLWQPSVADLETYVPKLEHAKAEKLLREFFCLTDVDFRSWLLMVKGKSKPPVDKGADGRVSLPQTIMYNESSGMNAMYSSQLSRFHSVFQAMLRPEVRINSNDSPADHEVWFNQHNARRASCRSVYRYEGDIFCYDRSQEDVGLICEAAFYRRMGLNENTLQLWTQTHGIKKATSMMLGVVIWLAQQGLSGIFKTLFRNGLICSLAVVESCLLHFDDIITLDVKGDDFLLEMNRRADVAVAVNNFALTFNLSTKFYGVDVAYFCSKYWLLVDGYWYWVVDPVRRAESISSAIACDGFLDNVGEKWLSLRDDLRHYDNGLIVDALAYAVKERTGAAFLPYGLICGLATLAADKSEFHDFYGPEETVG